MELTMDIIRPEHLEDCCEALRDSDLGRTYFTQEEKLYNLIQEGIDKQEIRVALDQEGRCLGFIWFTFGAAFYRFPYVRIFAVKNDYRSQGAGGFLMDCFEELSRQRQAGKVFLTVAEFNLRAKKFYEDRDYVEAARIPDLFHDGHAEFVMMKTLERSTGVCHDG